MEPLSPRDILGNSSVINEMTNSTDLHSRCYYSYQYKPTFYIVLLQGLIMIAGLIINLYLIIMLHSVRSKELRTRRKALSELDFFFTHLGVCHLVNLLSIPLWVSQMILLQGWVFGNIACKLMRGIIMFSFQYGTLVMVHVNIERYMKVVHERSTFPCLENKRRSSRRRIVVQACACLPLLSSLLDMCYDRVHSVAGVTVCYSSMSPNLKLVTLWTRTVFYIFLIVIVIYCNVRIAYHVRQHVRQTSLGNKLIAAQVVPMLSMTFLVCCWTPWIVSSLYYRTHVKCEELKYVVFNICVAIGNMYCVINPMLFIVMRLWRGTSNSTRVLSSVTR